MGSMNSLKITQIQTQKLKYFIWLRKSFILSFKKSAKITQIQTQKLKYFIWFSCAEWQLAEKDFDNFQ